MPNAPESAAVTVARAHVEAWSNHDYDTARKGLAADVTVSIATTMGWPRMDLVGVEDYMHGLTEFSKNVVAGSVRIDASTGDDRNALLMLTARADRPEHGTMTLHMARLYQFDEHHKIKTEQVTYYVVQD